MYEITSFDPSTLKGKLKTNGVNKNEQLMLYNDSIYRIRFHFNDGSTGIVPALWNKDYIIPTVAMGDITWEVVDQLNIANNPSSEVYGEIYEDGEHVASVNASMQRSVVSSIPGGVNTTTNTLQSTGASISPDGTNIITISDSLGNTFTVDNNGIWTWYVKIGAALVQVMKSNSIDPLIQIGATAHTLEVLSSLQLDGTLNAAALSNLVYNVPTGQKHSFQVNGGEEIFIDHLGITISSGDKITGNVGSNLDIDIPSTTNFVRLLNNGVDVLDATNTGPRLGTGMSYHFIVGTLSRQNGSGNTTCGAGTTITHGLGTTPALVLATPNIAQSGSATVGIGNVGATTFQATVGAGSAVSWWCLAG